MSLQEFRRAMMASDEFVHLNNAGVAPVAQPAIDAIHQLLERARREGAFAIEAHLGMYERSRATFAKILGTQPECVAYMQTCAAALSQVALGISLKSGDEIIRWDQEYPSNAYPWHVAAERAGAIVKIAPSRADLSLETSALTSLITPRTRVVVTSWVQFQTGAVADLPAISQACRQVGARFVVDAIQGLGAIPFDMKTSGADAVCGGTHKWLCGPLGHGFLALAPHRVKELQPLLHGAMTYGTPEDPVQIGKPIRTDIHRYEPGSPLLLGAVGAEASLQLLLRVGIEKIHAHALELADHLRNGLEARGATVLTPRMGTLRSPVVTFRSRQDIGRMAEAFKKHKISFARRAGGIRLSPHGFNTKEEMERVLAAVDSAQ